MALVLKKLPLPGCSPGTPWSLRALGTKQSCEVLEFLADIKESSPQSFKKITAVMSRAAKAGPQFHNKEICKRFKGLDYSGFLEFKGKVKGGHAVRILGFIDEGNLIICSHGFSKKDRETPPGELDKLIAARKKYIQAKNRKQITFED